MGQDFSLYASKETQAAIPPEDFKLMQQLLPQWAGRNVILVSKKDINPGMPTDGSAANDRLYTKNFLTFMNGLPLEKQTPPAGTPNSLQESYKKAAHGDFAAGEAPQFKAAGFMTVAVDYDHLNEIIPAGLAGMPRGSIMNVPGTSRDWMLATVAHETGHLASLESDATTHKNMKGRYSGTDDKLVYTTGREIAADKIGLRNYFELQARTPDISKDVPKAFMELRALGTIRTGSDEVMPWAGNNALTSLMSAPTDHGTSGAIKIQGDKITDVKNARPAVVDAAVIDVNTRVHMLLGLEYKDKVPEAGKKMAAERTNTILGVFNDPANKALALKDGKTVEQALGEQIGPQRAALLKQMSADTTGKARATMTTMMEGAALAHFDPLKEYAAMKFLYEKGEFKTPEQTKIVKDYIDAFEKHVAVNEKGPEMVRGYLEDMNRDWSKLQQQEKGMPYVQKAVDVSKAQLREPHAILEASTAPTTGMA